jgi:hypothetical protein
MFARSIVRGAVVCGSLALATLFTKSLVSQEPTVSRVRVRYLDPTGHQTRDIIGTLQTLTPDSLVISDASNATSFVVPTASTSTPGERSSELKSEGAPPFGSAPS